MGTLIYFDFNFFVVHVGSNLHEFASLLPGRGSAQKLWLVFNKKKKSVSGNRKILQ